MTKLLSELCQGYLEHDLCPHVIFTCQKKKTACEDQAPIVCRHCTSQDPMDDPLGCTRPTDADCPALEAFLDRTPEDHDDCDHWKRYDPSPPGISLPQGWMYECDCDGDPEQCPQKDWEDDFPGECQKGGV